MRRCTLDRRVVFADRRGTIDSGALSVVRLLLLLLLLHLLGLMPLPLPPPPPPLLLLLHLRQHLLLMLLPHVRRARWMFQRGVRGYHHNVARHVGNTGTTTQTARREGVALRAFERYPPPPRVLL